MSTALDGVCRDHRDEVASLVAMLKPLSSEQWQLATPAPGWSIADQVAHLAMFDERALWAISDPDRFIADRAAITTGGQYAQIHTGWASKAPAQLLDEWYNGALSLNEVAMRSDPSVRCDWYGPPMSITSKMTARIMETWAHAHDVADTLGVSVQFTARLRHVAHIGVRSRTFAFAAHANTAPSQEPFVELHTPDGQVWTWGESTARDVVRGPVLGFCQLVTQRRHLDDTSVVATGDGANAWVKIAQAFAGPPGKGRTAGEFTTVT